MYRIVYLTPNELIRKNTILKLQYEYSKSFLEEIVLPTVLQGSIEPKLTEFEKIFSGIKEVRECDVLNKIASVWYYFTKTSHASLGPRVGGFTEKLIAHFIEKYGGYDVQTNVTLGKLGKTFGIESNSRSKVDFVVKKGKMLSLIELRISEHTGGRTGQESLMDKFVKVLDWLEDKKLREKLISRGITEIHLDIAILFSEDSHKLLSAENYSRGRFNSLISYILDKRHIYGSILRLINKGYTLESSETKNIKNTLRTMLESSKSFSLLKDDFRIEFNVLFGNEFFERYTGKRFEELIEAEGNLIADDVWLFFTLTLNELKVSKMFSQTFVKIVYEFLTGNGKELSKKFVELYKLAKQSRTELDEYFKRLDEIASELGNAFMNYASNLGLKLRFLETNDSTAHYRYLKCLCLTALAIYKLKNRL